MTPARKQKLLNTLHKRQPDFTLISEQVHKPRNLAALLRNADAAGMHEIHSVRPKEGYHTFRGTTCGSDNWVKMHTHDAIDGVVARVREQGMVVYAAHLSDTAVDFRDVDYTRPCAILMGAEKYGISDKAEALADAHITIPMMGMVESFNVSTAAGIILSEAVAQRRKAGLYDQIRLPADEIALKMFEWGNRQVVEFCKLKGLAYPAYDGEGEILDAVAWNRTVREGIAPRYDWPIEDIPDLAKKD